MQGSDGTLYGMTQAGGANNSGGHVLAGEGTIFKITPAGTYSLLYSFGASATDGRFPYHDLVFDPDGNLYGVTSWGGANKTAQYGDGTFFRIKPDGTYTQLYSFGANLADGRLPSSTPTLGSDGNFYGVTAEGGAHGKGTFYRMTPAGAETVLYSFGACALDAAQPWGSVIEGPDGEFYGSAGGGANNVGAAFVVKPDGTETVIHSFDSNGAAFVRGHDGNFYGTTFNGGNSNGHGTAFVLGPDGTFETLYQFGANANDAVKPGHLTQSGNGPIYGVSEGGANSSGTIFTLAVSGTGAPQYLAEIATVCPATGDGEPEVLAGALGLRALFCLLVAMAMRMRFSSRALLTGNRKVNHI